MNNLLHHTYMKVSWNFSTIITLNPSILHKLHGHKRNKHKRNKHKRNKDINEINTVSKPNKNDKIKSLNTNHIYQNIQKEQPKEKIWTIPFLLESPRNKEFQPPDLEIDFLIDSGAESNIINIPTWNEIKTLHPKLTPLATSSKLATAQGSTLINLEKFNYSFFPQEKWNKTKF